MVVVEGLGNERNLSNPGTEIVFLVRLPPTLHAHLPGAITLRFHHKCA